MKSPSLSHLLDQKSPSVGNEDLYKRRLETLQHQMLRIQQGLYHSKQRAIVAMEGFDAAGKGGSIRRLTQPLDPRGVHVVPIGAPRPEEQGRHYLYRFWCALPVPGVLTVFDRTWYGRVLVERVEKLCSKEAWKRAYREINEFERMLTDDGVDVVKIFLAVSRKEQFRRFEERLNDPYKHWKIGEPDVRARKKWDDYVRATDDLLERTHTRNAPWHLISGDKKWHARLSVLETVTRALARHGTWIEKHTDKLQQRELKRELSRLR